MSATEDPENAEAGERAREGTSYWRDIDAFALIMQPLRWRAFVEAAKGPVSAKELAARLEVPLQRMSYHVRILADAGLLEVVSKTPRRGAIETHYRAVATIEFGDDVLLRSPEAFRTMLLMNLRLVMEDIEHELKRAPEVARELFLGRAHFAVDAAGAQRIRQELRDFYARLAELEAEHRVEDDDAEAVNLAFVLYPGRRSAGRNGPLIAEIGNDALTIPPG